VSFGPVKIKKRSTTYHHVVDVDVDVSLDEMSTEDLILELKERGEWVDAEAERAEILTAILDELRRGDPAEAVLLIERALSPKWRDPKKAQEEYDKAMRRAS